MRIMHFDIWNQWGHLEPPIYGELLISQDVVLKNPF